MCFKKITAAFAATIVFLSLLLTSCGGDKIEYELVEIDHEGLICGIPGHFVAYSHDEADAYYTSLNASVTVYAMTQSEVREKFTNYAGDGTAKSFSDFLVEMHEYNSVVNSSDDGSRALFTYLKTSIEDSTTYYYSNVVMSTDDMIYLVVFSCLSDKLDYYADMFVDCTNSIRLKEAN